MVFTDDNFQQEAEGFDGVVLIDFWAEWCGPCRVLSPIIEEIAEEMKDEKGLRVGKLDVDNNQATAQKFGIMSIPTMVFLKNGKPVNQLIGLRPKEEIIEKIKEALEA